MASDLKTSLTADTTLLEQQEQADASDVTTPIADLLALARSGRVGVSENATHIGHLIDVLVATSPVTLTENNDGGNETLAIALTAAMTAFAANVNGSGSLDLAALNTGVAAADTPLVADGTGGATTGSPGASSPEDITITAGEALSVRDYVCVRRSDGKAYKWRGTPTNSSSYENDIIRGVVVGSGIALDATGTMRVAGQVSGFSGLTPWEPVFVDTGTDGLITQVVPGYRAAARTDILQPGYAVAADTIVVKRTPIRCVGYQASVADNASFDVWHPDVGSPVVRRVEAYRYSNSGVPLFQDSLIVLGKTAFFSSSDVEISVVDTDHVGCTNRFGSTISIACVVEID